MRRISEASKLIRWYSPLTGEVSLIGRKVMKPGSNGYYRISCMGTQFLLHRVIWYFLNQEEPNKIDHKNHNKLDNSFDNLRKVSDTENAKNMSISKRNTSGITGVSQEAKSGLWRARLQVEGKEHTVGRFNSIEDARIAITKARNDFGFHINHGAYNES